MDGYLAREYNSFSSLLAVAPALWSGPPSPGTSRPTRVGGRPGPRTTPTPFEVGRGSQGTPDAPDWTPAPTDLGSPSDSPRVPWKPGSMHPFGPESVREGDDDPGLLVAHPVSLRPTPVEERSGWKLDTLKLVVESGNPVRTSTPPQLPLVRSPINLCVGQGPGRPSLQPLRHPSLHDGLLLLPRLRIGVSESVRDGVHSYPGRSDQSRLGTRSPVPSGAPPFPFPKSRPHGTESPRWDWATVRRRAPGTPTLEGTDPSNDDRNLPWHSNFEKELGTHSIFL